MKSFASSLAVLAIIAGAAGAFYYWQHSHRPAAPPLAAISSPLPTAAATPSATLYPVATESPGATTVPALDASDQSIEAQLGALFGKERFEALFNSQNLIRRIVVTVDNATAQKQPSQEFSPLKPLESEFRVSVSSIDSLGGSATIAPANFERYSPYVDLIKQVDAKKLVSIYAHFYPLFQSAYRDLGTKGYFNDRLVVAIDTILATPETNGPVLLARPTPRNKYKFVDNRLESLPAAQKILIRMGPQNARLIKGKLRQLRVLLTNLRR